MIEGEGLELHGPEGPAPVPWSEPHHFSGDSPIRSVLLKGPIRDFNVIYDGELVAADVTVLTGPQRVDLAVAEDTQLAVFGVTGPFSANARSAQAGNVVLADDSAPALVLDLPALSRVLVVRVVPL